MKKTVLTFGFIAGAVLAVMMCITIPLQDKIGFDNGAVIGYTTMVLAFLMVFLADVHMPTLKKLVKESANKSA